MDNWNGIQFTQQLNTEIEKLKDCDYTSYQNFYNETSQYLYSVIWNMVQDQNIADTLIKELYMNIYASIASELTDNSQFYMWAENKAQMLTTTYLTTHGLSDAYDARAGHHAGKAVIAAAANAGVDVATGAGPAGVGAGTYGAGQAGMGASAAGAGQAGVGTVAGVSGIGDVAEAGIASGVAHAGMSFGAKIAIGVAATAVVVGGSIGLYHVMSDKKKPADAEQTTEIVEQIATEPDAAMDSDAVEFAEAITDSNPVFAGYCFEQVVDDGDTEEVDGSIYYFRFVGDSTPELKQSFEEWQKQWVDDYYVWLDKYSEDTSIPEGYEDDMTDYELHSWVQCNRMDNRILTITHYQFAGGGIADDFYYVATTTNFDVQTGKILTLDDIGDVKGDLQNALTQYCQNAHNEGKYIPSSWEETIDEQLASNTLDWGMTYGYFYVQYEDYSGAYTIKIPYSELPGIKAEYLPEGNVYFEEIGDVSEYYDDSVQYDIDGDGVLESVGIYWAWGENYSDTIFYLTIDGTAVTEQFTAEVYDAYLCSINEKTYAILEIYGEGINSDYYIYDISSGSAIELQRFSDVSYMPIGPYPTARKTRIDVLGTYTGYKLYNLGSEGLTTDYNYYIFEDAEEITLSAKAEIPCKFENDGMLCEGTISAGTVIHPVECDTDNHVFVFCMEDGTRGRFYYAQDESGITINGVSETELFENLPYTE
ncbi:MAG: hypothetical protein ACI4L2_07540 [Wujia sp.]